MRFLAISGKTTKSLPRRTRNLQVLVDRYHFRFPSRRYNGKLWNEFQYVLGRRGPFPGAVPVCVCLIRNAEPFVELFIEHHQKSGFEHFLFIDNGSTDATIDLIAQYSGTTVWVTQLEFPRFAALARGAAVTAMTPENWVLILDSDELLRLPYDTAGADIQYATEYMDRHGYTAMIGQQLDLFRNGPLVESTEPVRRIQGGNWWCLPSDITREDVRSEIRWYGNIVANDQIQYLRGGIRKRLFGTNVTLTKVPLINSGKGVQYYGSHRARKAHFADTNCAVEHYLINSTLFAKAREHGYRHGSHNYSTFYGQIRDRLRDGGVDINEPDAISYQDCAELSGTPLVVVSESYRRDLPGKTDR